MSDEHACGTGSLPARVPSGSVGRPVICRWALSLILACVALGGLGGSAHADDSHLRPTHAKALDYYNEANRFARKTPPDYATAIIFYQRGLALQNAPGLLRNLGLALQRMGRLKDALHQLARYAAHPALTASERRKAKAHVDKLRARIPKPAAPEVSTPPQKDSVRPAPKSASPGAGLAAVSPLRTRPGHRSWASDWVGWGLTGAASAGLFLGGAYLLSAGTLQDQAAGETAQDEIQRLLDSSRTRRRIGVAALITGSGLLVGGILRLYSHPSHPSQPKRSHVALTLSVDSRGLSFLGRF